MIACSHVEPPDPLTLEGRLIVALAKRGTVSIPMLMAEALNDCSCQTDEQFVEFVEFIVAEPEL